MYGHKWFLRLGELTDASIGGLLKDANELIHCDYSFAQGTDTKGQASTEVQGAGISLVYDGLPTNELISWALESRKYLSGALVMCDSNNMPIHKVFFGDAALVGMRINYISEGDSSIMTQLLISPRAMTVGSEPINFKWTFDKVTEQYAKQDTMSAVKSLFRLAQPVGKTSLELLLDGNTYDVESFNITFHQPVDHKGQPQDEVKGGRIAFTIPQLPDSELNKWMFEANKLKSGEFAFKRNGENTPLRVKFDEAYCVGQKTHTAQGRGLATSLVISANVVTLNDKSVVNRFKL